VASLNVALKSRPTVDNTSLAAIEVALQWCYGIVIKVQVDVHRIAVYIVKRIRQQMTHTTITLIHPRQIKAMV